MSTWNNAVQIERRNFVCSYCHANVGPSLGYFRGSSGKGSTGRILICPSCDCPNFFTLDGKQFPGPTLGSVVTGITDNEVEQMFLEARQCSSVNAFTACVMVCRKILMNVAVHQGAPKGESFAKYVDFLEAKGFIPPNGKPWVDEIRKRGNTATHEIKLMSSADAQLILDFTAMLLRFVYEMPSKLQAHTKVAPAT